MEWKVDDFIWRLCSVKELYCKILKSPLPGSGPLLVLVLTHIADTHSPSGRMRAAVFPAPGNLTTARFTDSRYPLVSRLRAAPPTKSFHPPADTPTF